MVGVVCTRQNRYRDDCGKGVCFELMDQGESPVSRAICMNEQQTGMTPQDDRLHLAATLEREQRKRPGLGPLSHEGGNRAAVRRKKENRRASPHPGPLL